MSNVKPGDFAKVVRDDDFPRNIGTNVLVKEAFVSPPHITLMEIIWLCELLGPARLYKDACDQSKGMETFFPGTEALFKDSGLRRINPPPQGEDLWRDTPTDEEMVQALNRAIKEKMR